MSLTTAISKNRSATVRFPGRIVILGNDVVAWMAAVMLVRRIRPLGVRVTVCPGVTPSEPVFGAFSSSSALASLLRNYGIDEHDMMRACRGTYKLADQFSDWACEGRDFWVPAGGFDVRVEGYDLFDVWFSERAAGRLLRPLHSYSAHWTASLAGKSPHSFSSASPFAESCQYGFHGDSKELTAWFRSLAINLGVEEVAGGIQRVFKNGRGGIAQVRTDTGQAVPGDLFLNCRSPDNDESFSAASVSNWNDRFLCDRVVTVRVKSPRQVPPFTRITASENGWMRSTPLMGQVDCCYAFCHRLESDDQALTRLNRHVASNYGDQPDTNATVVFGSVSCGCREVFWKDNVVCLGQAACQLEPLASADLHLHLAGIEMLMELFPDRSGSRATRQEYNSRMTAVVNEFRDFVQLHYWLGSPDDVPFRNAVRESFRSDELKQRLAVFDAGGIVREQNPESIPRGRYQVLLAGCGRLPQRPSLAVRQIESVRLQQALRTMIQQNETDVKVLPLHEELLDWIHSGPFQQLAG